MKITETIFAQLTDTDTLLENVYQSIADEDPNFAEEMAVYEKGIRELQQAVPDAGRFLQARRQELASDIRFAMWQGFLWNLECYRNPVNKLLGRLDFEDLCQETRMRTLPAAQAARRKMDTFLRVLPKEKLDLLDPIIDHFAYLETYGYKLAYNTGFRLANELLPLVILGYINSEQH